MRKRSYLGLCLAAFCSLGMGNLYADSSESSASSLSDVEDGLGHLSKPQIDENRRRMNAKGVDKVLACSAALVEGQFGGQESMLKGASYVDKLMKKMSSQTYQYKDLEKSCRRELKAYKKEVDKGRMEQTSVNRESVVNQVSNRYNARVARVVEMAANPHAVCKTVVAFQGTVGLFLSVSAGYDHYVCETPLGRKFHLIGPNLGMGAGLGATAEMGSSAGDKRRRFTFPLNKGGASLESDDSQSFGWVVGSGKVAKDEAMNDENIKYEKVGVGLGFHDVKRAIFAMKIKTGNDFRKVYKTLAMPFY